jgi:NADPH:quinone reductase-like Zn-dependent oxidoreductase
VDAFAGGSLFQSLKATKSGGKIISLLPMISKELFDEAKDKNVEVHYSIVKSSGPDMEVIADLLSNGVIKSTIFKAYSFDQMGLAHLEMETGRAVGKIIIKV